MHIPKPPPHLNHQFQRAILIHRIQYILRGWIRRFVEPTAVLRAPRLQAFRPFHLHGNYRMRNPDIINVREVELNKLPSSRYPKYDNCTKNT